jgi:hypothetical protein
VTAGRPGPAQNSERARSDQEYSALNPMILSGLNATYSLAMHFSSHVQCRQDFIVPQTLYHGDEVFEVHTEKLEIVLDRRSEHA